MSASVALFTADLRLHDNPVLRAALDGVDEVVPAVRPRSGRTRRRASTRPTGAPFSPTASRTSTLGCATAAAGSWCARGDVVEEVCGWPPSAVRAEVHIAGGVSALRAAPRGTAAARIWRRTAGS